jgi:hypothetical protein
VGQARGARLRVRGPGWLYESGPMCGSGPRPRESLARRLGLFFFCWLGMVRMYGLHLVRK